MAHRLALGVVELRIGAISNGSFFAEGQEKSIQYLLLNHGEASTDALGNRTAEGGLWWIVLIVAGVILIVLILFVIGYCLRQSGQTYPVDKKERDAGHDPVKELKDAGCRIDAGHHRPQSGGHQ